MGQVTRIQTGRQANHDTERYKSNRVVECQPGVPCQQGDLPVSQNKPRHGSLSGLDLLGGPQWPVKPVEAMLVYIVHVADPVSIQITQIGLGVFSLYYFLFLFLILYFGGVTCLETAM